MIKLFDIEFAIGDFVEVIGSEEPAGLEHVGRIARVLSIRRRTERPHRLDGIDCYFRFHDLKRASAPDLVVTCHHLSGDENTVKCSTIGGGHMGLFRVPFDEAPFGPWLSEQVLEATRQMTGRLCLCSPDGNVFWSAPEARRRLPKPPVLTSEVRPRRRMPGEIRMQKELDELELPPQAKLDFPDKDDILKFNITISPDEGFWRGAAYVFSFSIPDLYPRDAPRVICETRIYHPNIDLQGNICLNLLHDWKQIFSCGAIILGLLILLLGPHPHLDGTGNHEAAENLRSDAAEFGRLVALSLQGGAVAGATFPKLL